MATQFDISRPSVPTTITITSTEETEIAEMREWILKGWTITATEEEAE